MKQPFIAVRRGLVFCYLLLPLSCGQIIPGVDSDQFLRLQAEDYNAGGEGIGYHDTTPTNLGGYYRQTEAVDIDRVTANTEEYYIGWNEIGEWLNYSVTTTHDADYYLALRVAGKDTAGKMHIEIDNVNVTGSITLPITGDWYSFKTIKIPAFHLQPGTHQLRWVVESAGFNVDYFELTNNASLLSSDPVAQPSLARLFLQQVTFDSAIVKWRGTTQEVHYGANKNNLTETAQTIDLGNGDFKVELSGLSADTHYYYSFGDATAVDDYSFRTAPLVGSLPSDNSTRVWIVGDSGTGDESALAVRDGYTQFNNNSVDADLFLMLGDNAYGSGTDAEYQSAVFNTYPKMLRKTSLWPTIGNHEMGSSGSSTSSQIGSAPYISIFDLPTNGEAGGIASGTEQYYSFDFGNAHFVCLDSQVSSRDATKMAVMKQWLIDDLSGNSLDWTIVFFHHPAYSKGSHDSDGASGVDQPMTDMRQQYTPLFDSYGVDLVYTGHSHSYERSYYINGHTGLSSTFNKNTHGELDSSGNLLSGKTSLNEEYSQITRTGRDDKVVYTVAGSAGKISGGSLNHPAHYASKNILGSVVLDIGRQSLTASFVGVSGNVLDSFTMTR